MKHNIHHPENKIGISKSRTSLNKAKFGSSIASSEFSTSFKGPSNVGQFAERKNFNESQISIGMPARFNASFSKRQPDEFFKTPRPVNMQTPTSFDSSAYGMVFNMSNGLSFDGSHQRGVFNNLHSNTPSFANSFCASGSVRTRNTFGSSLMRHSSLFPATANGKPEVSSSKGPFGNSFRTSMGLPQALPNKPKTDVPTLCYGKMKTDHLSLQAEGDYFSNSMRCRNL